MINYEKDVCKFLSIPSIPKKQWDGKSSFKDGVAILKNIDNSESYAIATFDSERDERPNVKKVFGLLPFVDIVNIFVVPSYMDKDTKHFDLDNKSLKAAKAIIEEAEEFGSENIGISETVYKHEYFFDNIKTDEEAKAFISAYNKRNGIKGHLPNTHDSLVMRLGVIYRDMNKK